MRPNRRIQWEFAGPFLAGTLLLTLLCLLPSPTPEPRNSSTYPSMEEIYLDVRKKDMWKLRVIRERALLAQVLESTDDDFVAGTLRQGGHEWRVDLRLKGDWTDHLEGGKWSFRIKIKGGEAFKRLKVFSLQSPHTRNFLDEWYFHKVLRQEGVLAPYYDFVRVHFNGTELGVYAIEEHFTKELLESQGRREGPIVKFNEAGMWEARRVALESPELPYTDMPHFEAAHPEAFQSGKFAMQDLEDGPDEAFPPDRPALMHAALSQLHSLKYDLRPAAETMDLRSVARQYALTDLFRGHHSLVWHNRRFYFDPIAARLEPVVFDGFAGPRGGDYLNGPFIGYACNGQTFYNGREDRMGIALFREPGFLRAYYACLHQYSSPAFLDSLEASLGGELARREAYLRREFMFYRYDREGLRRNARTIRDALETKVDLVREQDGDAQCLYNYTAVAVELTLQDTALDGSVSERRMVLGAYDGRNPADMLYLPANARSRIDAEVLGTGNSLSPAF